MKNIIEKFKSLFGKSELDNNLRQRIQTSAVDFDGDAERIARWSDDIANNTTIKIKPDPRQTKLKKYKNVKRPNEFEKGKPRFYGEK